MTAKMDFMQLCRLCLVKDQVNVPIFGTVGNQQDIFLKISACLPVMVGKEDKLPKKICEGCVYKLDLLYQFYNTATSAEKQLLSWLNETLETKPDGDADFTATSAEVITLKEEPNTDIADASDENYMQHQLSYNHDAPFEPAVDDKVVEDTAEPAAKRPRRSAAKLRKPIIESDDDDDVDDPAEFTTKTEDDSEIDEEMHEIEEIAEPSFVNVPEQDASQPGPSGLATTTQDFPKKQTTEDLFEKYEKQFGLKRCSVYLGELKNRNTKMSPKLEATPTVPRLRIKPIQSTDTVTEVDLTNIVYTTRQKYKCTHCDARFKDYSSMQKHRVMHEEDHPFEPESSDGNDSTDDSASIASESAGSSDEEKDSQVTSGQEKESAVTSDQEKESQVTSDDDEVKEETKTEKFTCRVCRKSLKFYVNYVIHCNQYLHFSCAKCTKTFKSRVLLDSHTKLIHNMINCQLCPQQFYSQKNLDMHITEKHRKVHRQAQGTTWSCEICSMEFGHFVRLVGHNKLKHSLQCSICGVEFATFALLTAHRFSYYNYIKSDEAGNNVFECKHCKKTFQKLPLLHEHKKLYHPGLIKLQNKSKSVCDLCNIDFGNLELLQAHLPVHFSIVKVTNPEHGGPGKPDSVIKVKVASDNSEHKCTLCAALHTSEDHLNEHLKGHIFVHHQATAKEQKVQPVPTAAEPCTISDDVEEVSTVESDTPPSKITPDSQTALPVRKSITDYTLPDSPSNTLAVSQMNTLPVTPSNTLPVTQSNTLQVTQSNILPVSPSHTLPVIQNYALPVSQSYTLPVSQSYTLPVSQSFTLPVSQSYTIPVSKIMPASNTLTKSVSNSPSTIRFSAPMNINTVTTTTPTMSSNVRTTGIMPPPLTALPTSPMIVFKNLESQPSTSHMHLNTPPTTVTSNILTPAPLILGQNQAKVMLLDGKRYLLVADSAMQDNSMLKMIATNQPQPLPPMHPIGSYLQTAINQTIVLPNSQNNSKISITNKTYNSGNNSQEMDQGTTNIVMESTEPEFIRYGAKNTEQSTTKIVMESTKPEFVQIGNTESLPVAVETPIKSDDKANDFVPKIFLKPMSQLLQNPVETVAPAPIAAQFTVVVTTSLSTPTKPSIINTAASKPYIRTTLPTIVSIQSGAELRKEAALKTTTATIKTITSPLTSGSNKVLLVNTPKPKFTLKTATVKSSDVSNIPTSVVNIAPATPTSVLKPNTGVVSAPQEPTAVPISAPPAKPSVILNVTPSNKITPVKPLKLLPKVTIVSVEEQSTSSTKTAEPQPSTSTDSEATAAADSVLSASKTKEAKRIYRCNICGITCKKLGRFRQHRNKYSCKVCDFGCCKLKILDTHYEQQHQYRNRCASCDMQFPTNLELQLHKKNVHLCIKCNRCYLDLSKHKTNHKCSNCEFTACNAVNLDGHYRLVHSVSSRCVPCNIPFYNLEAFGKHKDEMHFCTKCGTYKMDLNIHKTFCKGPKTSEDANYVGTTTDEVITLDSD